MGALFMVVRFPSRLALAEPLERDGDRLAGLDPFHSRLSREPCPLPPGERAGCRYDLSLRLLPVRASGNPLRYFAIPDSAKSVRVRRNSAREKSSHLGVPARFQHLPDSCRDPSIEVLARRPEAELDHSPALVETAAGTRPCRGGSAGLEHDLNGSQ